jgi:hypothetical protein
VSKRPGLWIILATVGLSALLGWFLHAQFLRGRSGFTSATPPNDLVFPRPSESAWPQLRGPTFDSYTQEIEFADAWPDAGPPVLWTRELGQGYSGFIAVGQRVFTQTQTLYRQSLVCLDAETGETIWTHHYGWPYDGGGLYPGPRATPTWFQGRVYYAAPEGTIGCVDAASGTPVWSWNPKKTYRGRGTDSRSR